MELPNRKISVIIILVWIFLAVSAPSAPAQPSRAPGSSDALLRSIGVTKARFATAPDFSLRDATGGYAGLSGQRGSLVLLNFWATWCAPCREEMPSMEQLSRSFGGQGFTILAVNQRESAAQVNSFMRRHGLNFTVPLDSAGRVSNLYRVFGIPVSYLIDGNGRAIGMKAGSRDWASRDVIEVFRKLIGGDGGAAAGISLEPASALPSALRAKAAGAALHAQQDGESEIVARLGRDEEALPLGKTAGAGEFWYMVRTKSGVIGWTRGSEIDEVRRGKSVYPSRSSE